jgi:hypothetical protein
MKALLIAITLFMGGAVHSQQLSQVTFSGGSSLAYISFLTDQNVLIRISDEGKVLEWGIEMMSNRYNYYAPKLQPFMGRIEYYGPEADSAFRGKVKSIGTCSFTYFYSYETDNKAGKLRSIGTVFLDYYSNFDDKVLRGKLKLAGSNPVTYYTSFENEAYRGKIKSIGNTLITYYSNFDDKQIRGKIKNIGSVPFDWYTSFDVGRGGGLKSGNYRQNINGITFILN